LLGQPGRNTRMHIRLDEHAHIYEFFRNLSRRVEQEIALNGGNDWVAARRKSYRAIVKLKPGNRDRNER